MLRKTAEFVEKASLYLPSFNGAGAECSGKLSYHICDGHPGDLLQWGRSGMLRKTAIVPDLRYQKEKSFNGAGAECSGKPMISAILKGYKDAASMGPERNAPENFK